MQAVKHYHSSFYQRPHQLGLDCSR